MDGKRSLRSQPVLSLLRRPRRWGFCTSRRLAKRSDRLERLNRQLNEFYGLLLVLISASNSAWEAFSKRVPTRTRVFVSSHASESRHWNRVARSRGHASTFGLDSFVRLRPVSLLEGVDCSLNSRSRRCRQLVRGRLEKWLRVRDPARDGLDATAQHRSIVQTERCLLGGRTLENRGERGGHARRTKWG
jgi:hypothetical protein